MDWSEISAASTYHFALMRGFYLPHFRGIAASTYHMRGFYLPHFRGIAASTYHFAVL